MYHLLVENDFVNQHAHDARSNFVIHISKGQKIRLLKVPEANATFLK